VSEVNNRTDAVRDHTFVCMSGCGKSALVNELARVTGNSDYITVHVDDQMDSKTLLGSYIATTTPGEFVWQAGLLTQVIGILAIIAWPSILVATVSCSAEAITAWNEVDIMHHVTGRLPGSKPLVHLKCSLTVNLLVQYWAWQELEDMCVYSMSTK